MACQDVFGSNKVSLSADYLSAFLKHHEMPVTRLQWSFVGEGTAEGGGQRYVLLREYGSLADAVWMVPRSIGSGRRRRVESFDATARRLQASSLQRRQL